MVALFAAGLTALLLQHRGERDHVSAYIEQVNAVQRSFALRFGSVNQVYQEFRFSTADLPKQLPRLRLAAREMTTLRSRIERVDPPKPAEELRRRLIRYFRQQEAVGYELVDITEYLRTLAGAEREVARASAALRAALQAADAPEAQTAVVLRYARQLDAVARELDATSSPALLAPSQRAYIRQLQRYSAAALALERAVAADDRNGTESALRNLRNAGSASTATFRAQADAIRDYNRRVESIRRLGVAVEKERRRLEAELD